MRCALVAAVAGVVGALIAPAAARAGGVRATLTCKRYYRIAVTIVDPGKADAQHDDDAAAPPPPGAGPAFDAVEQCEVRVPRLPAGAVVTFRRVPPRDDGDQPVDVALEADPAGGFHAVTRLEAWPSPGCKPWRVDAWIAVDGEVAWSGHTTYPACERPRARLACKTPDGHPIAPHARLDRDVTCEVDLDGPARGELHVEAVVTQPLGTTTVSHDEDTGGAATFTRGELLACAPTTFRGSVVDRGVATWSAELAIKPSCPRARVAATLACAPTPDVAAVACRVALARASTAPLRAWFASELDTSGAITSADLVGAELSATLPADAEAVTPCRPAYARAALATFDGAVAWTGNAAIRTCGHDKLRP